MMENHTESKAKKETVREDCIFIQGIQEVHNDGKSQWKAETKQGFHQWHDTPEPYTGEDSQTKHKNWCWMGLFNALLLFTLPLTQPNPKKDVLFTQHNYFLI